eukprot:sb/3476327/
MPPTLGINTSPCSPPTRYLGILTNPCSPKVSIENSNFNSDNMIGKFKFKEYCPLVFRNLRERFAVKEEVFNQALSANEPYYEERGESQKERSSKFFFSKDNRFVIKLFHTEEYNVLAV